MSSFLRITLLYLIAAVSVFAADPAFEQGIEAYQNGQYTEAKAQFAAALEAGETAAARHNLGLAHFQLGEPAEAVWQLERAQLLAPFNADYRFKLGAIRQELGLFAGAPSWASLACQALSTQHWILLASISFWLLLAACLLPRIGGTKAGLWTKSLRLISLIALLLALPAIWLNLRLLQTGTILTDESVSLHAAPASAAPESGTARPGERARILDHYNNFYEVETEGLASGWISKDAFRPLADSITQK
jgi:tetratricopeptide (TPR) repeat protein